MTDGITAGAVPAITGTPPAPAIGKTLSGKALILDGRFTIAPSLPRAP
jgi:hypothetical protein